MPFRFHLDESVHAAVALGLQRRGVDVTTPQEAGLLGKSDAEQLEFARNQERLLITCDKDFLGLARLSNDHPGIIYYHYQKYSVGQVIGHIVQVAMSAHPEQLQNQVTFL